MVIDAVPSVEMVRFTNSGTEACMGMLRLVQTRRLLCTASSAGWTGGGCTESAWCTGRCARTPTARRSSSSR
eukprot:908495-Rhodomonas_salina.1